MDSPYPSTTRTPVAINSVQAQYRIDTGSWVNATATDGAFNSDYEPFIFTSAAQSSGPHTLTMRAINNRGNSATTSPFNVTVDATPPPALAQGDIYTGWSSDTAEAGVWWQHGSPEPESGTPLVRAVLRQRPTLTTVATADVPSGPLYGYKFTGLSLMHGGVYDVIIYSVNGAGVLSSTYVGGYVPSTLTVDLTPPNAPASCDDWAAGTDQLNYFGCNWPAATDDLSPIVGYMLEVSDDQSNVLGTWWTQETWCDTDEVSLVLGRKYFGRVQALNAAQLWGPYSPYSTGVLAATLYPSIGQLKLTGTLNTPVFVNNVYVTSAAADQPGRIFVEHADGSCGIETDSVDTWARDRRAQVAGWLTPDASRQLLVLTQSEVDWMGAGTQQITPVGMSGRALGGGAAGLQPAAINGSGANNAGLLVQVWGQVTYVSSGPPYYFSVDDGSGAVDQYGHSGVGVRCGSVTPPGMGTSVTVRGVCSYEAGGYPVVMMRQSGDWW